jgi:hypothetical protein
MHCASIPAIVHNSMKRPGGLSERRLPKRFNMRSDSIEHESSGIFQSAVNSDEHDARHAGRSGPGQQSGKGAEPGYLFSEIV